MLIHERVMAQAEQTPGRVFCYLQCKDDIEAITYSTLLSDMQAFASEYRNRGASKGDIAIIILKHSRSLYGSFLGAMLAGCIPSFMPFPSVKQDRQIYWHSQRELFQRTQAKFLVTYEALQDELNEHWPSSEEQRIIAPLSSEQPSWFSSPRIAANDTALLQHSSGTTGGRKGVALSHRAVLSQVESYAHAIGLRSSDVIVSWLPLYHDMGLIACFLLPVLTGTPLVAMDPFEWVARPQILFEAVERFKGTHVWLPNFAFHHLANMVSAETAYDLSSMRAFINCSESCKSETFRMFLEKFGAGDEGFKQKLQVSYAMAENVFAVAQTRLDEPVRSIAAERKTLQEEQLIVDDTVDGKLFLSCGTPINGVQIKIIGPQNEELSDRSIGRIAISGDFLFSEYFRLPELTKSKIHAGWYFTDDLGFLDRGELFVTGRQKELMVIHAKNIYAHDVEFILNQIAELKPGRNVVFSRYDEKMGTDALYVVAETRSVDSTVCRRLQREVKERIAAHLDVTPRRVELVSPGWIVKTTSGKISRELNVAKFVKTFEESNHARQP